MKSAHETQVKGTVSELTAARALLNTGWEVSFPFAAEVYDLVAKDPINGEFKTIQVKTIRRREDRNNELVVYTTNGKGEPYSVEDCDYIAAVENETVYLFENTELKEYWASDQTAAKRWITLAGGEATEIIEEAVE
jgi:hypothetical protein